MPKRTLFLIAVIGICGAAVLASAAGLKVIKAQKAQDVTVSLLSESGQWKVGPNEFVISFTSPKDHAPVDAGKVALSTSMPMPGMAPMLAGATVEPDGAPGRYRGRISFPDRGDRQVTVTWDGPGGKGSTRFSVPVR